MHSNLSRYVVLRNISNYVYMYYIICNSSIQGSGQTLSKLNFLVQGYIGTPVNTDQVKKIKVSLSHTLFSIWSK